MPRTRPRHRPVRGRRRTASAARCRAPAARRGTMHHGRRSARRANEWRWNGMVMEVRLSGRPWINASAASRGAQEARIAGDLLSVLPPSESENIFQEQATGLELRRYLGPFDQSSNSSACSFTRARRAGASPAGRRAGCGPRNRAGLRPACCRKNRNPPRPGC
jgi:hypothetical protein